MKRLISTALSSAITIITIACHSTVHAQQSFPERPITAIVPFSAGGGNDILLRLVAKYANDALGQTIVVDNKPGAGGQIGWTSLAKAKPDGYTIGATSFPSMVLIKALRPSTPYEISDFAYICNIQVDPIIWVVNADSPFKTAQDFVKAAASSQQPLNVGGDGPQSNVQLQHLAATQALGIETNFVPFNGSSAALTSLLGGNLDMAATTLSAATSQIKAGKVRPLLVFSEKAVESLPGVPTATEALGKPVAPIGMAVRGIAAPKDVPTERLKKLESACQQIVQSKEFQDETQRMGLMIQYMDSQQATQAVEDSVQAIEKLKGLMQ